MNLAMDLAAHYIATCTDRLRGLKSLADRAIAQLDAEQMHAVPHEDANSVVVLMKHMAGNMLSRWTDFLTTDGEKPDRNREGEFIDDFESRDQLDAFWGRGWGALFDALDELTPEDLGRTVYIRGEPHTVMEAIQRQVSHYGYHVGQLVQRARDLRGAAWTSLSIPRGGSVAFNEVIQRPE